MKPWPCACFCFTVQLVNEIDGKRARAPCHVIEDSRNPLQGGSFLRSRVAPISSLAHPKAPIAVQTVVHELAQLSRVVFHTNEGVSCMAQRLRS